MKALTRLPTTTVHDLVFTEDCALKTTIEQDMPRRLDFFAAAYANFGWTINADKTVIMHQSPENTGYSSPRINVNKRQLKTGEKFTCPENASIDSEAVHQLSKASQVSGRLQASTWNRRGLRLNIKVKMHKAVVLTTFLYGAEI
ncbi:hypothetical protein SprV_0501954800 [Sparganum proliferum]